MAPSTMWETTYSASRRARHHRCCCGCNKIIKDGQAVIMRRTPRGTLALLAEHAARAHGDDLTALEWFALCDREHRKILGWAPPEAPKAKAA